MWLWFVGVCVDVLFRVSGCCSVWWVVCWGWCFLGSVCWLWLLWCCLDGCFCWMYEFCSVCRSDVGLCVCWICRLWDVCWVLVVLCDCVVWIILVCFCVGRLSSCMLLCFVGYFLFWMLCFCNDSFCDKVWLFFGVVCVYCWCLGGILLVGLI